MTPPRRAASTSTSAILAAVLAACQPTASIGSTAGGAPPSTTSGSTTAAGSTSSTTAPIDADTTTGTPPDLGDDTSTGHGHPDPSGGDPACTPAPFDVPCIDCAKHECCAAFAACADDFDCSCTLGCIQYAGPFGCMCPPSPLAGRLFDCMMPTCNQACEPP